MGIFTILQGISTTLLVPNLNKIVTHVTNNLLNENKTHSRTLINHRPIIWAKIKRLGLCKDINF